MRRTGERENHGELRVVAVCDGGRASQRELFKAAMVEAVHRLHVGYHYKGIPVTVVTGDL